MCTSLWPRRMPRPVVYTLTADAELLDEVKVGLAVFGSDVLQETLALTNELQKTATSRKIFFVHLEVLSKLLDTLGVNTNLYSRAAGIGFVALQILDSCLFFLTCNHTQVILTERV